MMADVASIINEIPSNCDEEIVNSELDEVQIDVHLECYSQDEIKHIKDIVKRDKYVRDIDHERKKKLEDELEEFLLSNKSEDIDSEETYCPLCHDKFSFFMNKKRICLLCEKGYCGNCLHKFNNSSMEICKGCVLECNIEGKTGRWFNCLSETNGRLRRSASVVVLNSIRRIKKMPNKTPERQSFHYPEPIKEMPSCEEDRRISSPARRPPSRPGQDVEDHNEGRKLSSPMRNPPEIPRIPRRSYLNSENCAELQEKIETGNQNIRNSTNGPDKRTDEIRGDTMKANNTVQSNLGSMSSLSTSAMSMYSDTEESYKTGITISGDIYIATYYDETKRMLSVYIDQCRNLAVADRKKRKTDPYIKTYLLPDKTKTGKRKSTIKKTSLSPVFKETLSYYMSRQDLLLRVLCVSVWHKSSFLKYNIFLGEVQLNLAETDLNTKECNWHTLCDRKKYSVKSVGLLSKGELVVTLRFKPSTLKSGKGTLHVLIVGAKNLEHDKASICSYVKGYLLPDMKTKKKTVVSKGTLNPTWNSPWQFPDVSLNDLGDRSLQLSIFHQNVIKGNEFLGGIRLNLGLGLHCLNHVQWMDAQGPEKVAWETLLSNSQDITEFSIPLRSDIDY